MGALAQMFATFTDTNAVVVRQLQFPVLALRSE